MDRSWQRAPAELVERFREAVAGIEGLEVRSMFGHPAGFVGGHMTTGLHGATWFVRLPPEERAASLAAGWTTFEPMPGRPMRDYVSLPPEVAGDGATARSWVERAAGGTRALPPKVRKPRRSATTG